MNVADARLRTVVGAKSLFDTLAKDCDSREGEDRTAIELSIVKESMCSLGAEVRWVPHLVMPIDEPTKLRKSGHSNDSLHRSIESATFRLQNQSEIMLERSTDHGLKGRTRRSSCQHVVESWRTLKKGLRVLSVGVASAASGDFLGSRFVGSRCRAFG
jgi:hypothetical protein